MFKTLSAALIVMILAAMAFAGDGPTTECPFKKQAQGMTPWSGMPKVIALNGHRNSVISTSNGSTK